MVSMSWQQTMNEHRVCPTYLWWHVCMQWQSTHSKYPLPRSVIWAWHGHAPPFILSVPTSSASPPSPPKVPQSPLQAVTKATRTGEGARTGTGTPSLPNTAVRGTNADGLRWNLRRPREKTDLWMQGSEMMSCHADVHVVFSMKSDQRTCRAPSLPLFSQLNPARPLHVAHRGGGRKEVQCTRYTALVDLPGT